MIINALNWHAQRVLRGGIDGSKRSINKALNLFEELELMWKKPV